MSTQSENDMAKKSSEARDPNQTIALQVRIREDLRARIEAAASASGRSMNAEIADRLDSSFREDEAFTSAETKRAMLVMAKDIAEVERISGKSWTSDLATARAVGRVLADTVRRLEPPVPNYDEVTEFLRHAEEHLARHKTVQHALIQVGALRLVQPNALLAITSRNGSAAPFPKLEEDESTWHQIDQPGTPLSEAEVESVRALIAEFKELEDNLPMLTERLSELRQPMIEADRRAQELHNEYRHGFDRLVEKAMNHGA